MCVLPWLVIVLAVNAITAVPITNEYDSSTYVYPRFIEFPDGEGIMHPVDLEEPFNRQIIDDYTRNPANNRYYLYTRRNPGYSQEIIFNDVESVLSSNFDTNLPTVVVAHGWISNQNTNINPIIRDAYLELQDCNVIILDWSRLAIGSYTLAVNGVPAVGRGLGQFLEFLVTLGARYETMHLVGFSLGAHLVGNAGRYTGGSVARVTGLDPAGPLWNFNRDRLSARDGQYVEAIHTDGGYTIGGLGIGTALAQADFFPNGGISQPGCLTNICNHNRAWELFAASVTYDHLLANHCRNSLQITFNNCRGDVYPMGNANLNKSGSGLYRLTTGRRHPF